MRKSHLQKVVLRMKLDEIVPHSCCARVVRVALVSLVSGTCVVKYTGSLNEIFTYFLKKY